MEDLKYVKDENFIVIQGFMINELKLKGNELLVYAIIYGFTQAENQRFTGGLQYLADWTSSTKQGIIKNLKSLIDKGLIVKEEKFINNVKFVEYYVSKFNGIKQSLMGGIKQSLTNNIINNNINNIKKEVKEKKTDFDLLIEAYTFNEELRLEIYEFIKMRKAIKKSLTNHALELMFKKLDSIAKNDDDKIKVLQQSISNCWQGIFPLNDNKERKKESNNDTGEVFQRNYSKDELDSFYTNFNEIEW